MYVPSVYVVGCSIVTDSLNKSSPAAMEGFLLFARLSFLLSRFLVLLCVYWFCIHMFACSIPTVTPGTCCQQPNGVSVQHLPNFEQHMCSRDRKGSLHSALTQ